MGYSIHKLDVDDLEPVAGSSSDLMLERLPAPCALRIQTSDDSPPILAPLGSKIFFVINRHSDDEASTLIYDTETESLAMGPRPTPAMRPLGFMFMVPVEGQRLYAFNPRRADLEYSFEVVARSAPRSPEDEDDAGLARRRDDDRWSVESVQAPMPLLKYETVTAYAVHPDGRTIFVSAKNWAARPINGEMPGGTHSFDAWTGAWTWHGGWKLPFLGQAYYVDELGAWVGLREDGFLCSCAVPSRRGTATLPPDWKLVGNKTLFREDLGRHVDQQPADDALAYMGDSRFCLVECAGRQGHRMEKVKHGEVDGCVLHVSVFSVKYDKRGGDLQTMAHQSRSYLVSIYGALQFTARTFWM